LATSKHTMMVNFFTTALYVSGLANVAFGNYQPWLDQSLHFEDRLQSFIAQLNTTRKIAMTSGDTEVKDPFDVRAQKRGY
jgi:hypothetical protein